MKILLVSLVCMFYSGCGSSSKGSTAQLDSDGHDLPNGVESYVGGEPLPSDVGEEASSGLDEAAESVEESFEGLGEQEPNP